MIKWVVGMGKTNNNRLRPSVKAGEFCRFYLVNPKENASIDSLAERLIGFKEVEEVYVTDGAHGFLVKTRFSEGKEPKDLGDYLKRRVDKSYGEMNAYFTYKK